MTISAFEKKLTGVLTEQYGLQEARSIAQLAVMHVLKLNKAQLRLRGSDALSTDGEQELDRITDDLTEGRPLQYVLGETLFYDCRILVNEHVLIPRPETEELVHWVLNDLKRSTDNQSKHVLDLCTGSGCIAIALKKAAEALNVSGMDLSEPALETAKKNARLNGVGLAFFQGDVLQLEDAGEKRYDIIVSNPPYIRHSEASLMQANVLDHEPHLALFVDDQDPLIFYRKIAEYASKALSAEGVLYFEINEAFGSEMCDLMRRTGFSEIELKKDLFGRDRMMKAVLKEIIGKN